MYLLDTNVVSELRKIRSGKADGHVKKWASKVEASELYISAITIQELEVGVLLAERRDSKKGAVLRAWLNERVWPTFQDRILSVDAMVAARSAAIHVPDPKPFRDSLIAATALVHRMTLVTRNTADFEAAGVKLINPWIKTHP